MILNRIKYKDAHDVLEFENNQIYGYTVLYNTNKSVKKYAGGIRIQNYNSKIYTLNTAYELAKNMSLKSQYAKIPFGGCKTVLNLNGKKIEKSEIHKILSKVIEYFKGQIIIGPDSGFSDMDLIDLKNSLTKISLKKSFISKADKISYFTSQGVLGAIDALAFPNSVEKKEIILLGYGQVGKELTKSLIKKNVSIDVYDIDDTNYSALLKNVNFLSSLDNSFKKYDFCILAGPKIDLNIFEKLKFKNLLSITNIPIRDNSKEIFDIIKERNIIFFEDYKINYGGLLGCWYDYNDELNKLDSIKNHIYDNIASEINEIQVKKQYDSKEGSLFYKNIMGEGSNNIHYGLFHDKFDSMENASQNTIKFLINRIEKKLPVNGCRNIIDLGSGNGGAMHYIADKYLDINITCVNLCEEQNKINQISVDKKQYNNRFNINDLSFDNLTKLSESSFDIVWSQEAFSHSVNKNNIFYQVRNIMHKNSIFIFTDIMCNDKVDHKKLSAYQKHNAGFIISPKEYKLILLQENFKIIEYIDFTDHLKKNFLCMKNNLIEKEKKLIKKGVSKTYINNYIKSLDKRINFSNEKVLKWGMFLVKLGEKN